MRNTRCKRSEYRLDLKSTETASQSNRDLSENVSTVALFDVPVMTYMALEYFPVYYGTQKFVISNVLLPIYHFKIVQL